MTKPTKSWHQTAQDLDKVLSDTVEPRPSMSVPLDAELGKRLEQLSPSTEIANNLVPEALEAAAKLLGRCLELRAEAYSLEVEGYNMLARLRLESDLLKIEEDRLSALEKLEPSMLANATEVRIDEQTLVYSSSSQEWRELAKLSKQRLIAHEEELVVRVSQVKTRGTGADFYGRHLRLRSRFEHLVGQSWLWMLAAAAGLRMIYDIQHPLPALKDENLSLDALVEWCQEAIDKLEPRLMRTEEATVVVGLAHDLFPEAKWEEKMAEALNKKTIVFSFALEPARFAHLKNPRLRSVGVAPIANGYVEQHYLDVLLTIAFKDDGPAIRLPLPASPVFGGSVTLAPRDQPTVRGRAPHGDWSLEISSKSVVHGKMKMLNGELSNIHLHLNLTHEGAA